MLRIEDYDSKTDDKFVNDTLVPYFKALYSDLLMRSSNSKHIDKVTFIEYTKLPGIINDRLHLMFSEYRNSGSKDDSPSAKQKIQDQKK